MQFSKRKKKDYDAKISDIEGKYFISADCNKFKSDMIVAKIKKTRKI